MEKIKYTVLHHFNNKQAKSYAASHQHLDVIFNLDKSIKIGIWSKYQAELISNILTLMDSYLQLQKQNQKLLICDVNFDVLECSTYNQLSVIIPINKEWYYSFKLGNYHENEYNSDSSIVIQKHSSLSDYKTIYQYDSMHTVLKTKIHNDDDSLGFYKPEAAKIRLGLCYSCEYFANSTSILCAVNPYVRAKTCFDCKDYQLKSHISPEEYELSYKYNQ